MAVSLHGLCADTLVHMHSKVTCAEPKLSRMSGRNFWKLLLVRVYYLRCGHKLRTCCRTEPNRSPNLSPVPTGVRVSVGVCHSGFINEVIWGALKPCELSDVSLRKCVSSWLKCAGMRDGWSVTVEG